MNVYQKLVLALFTLNLTSFVSGCSSSSPIANNPTPSVQSSPTVSNNPTPEDRAIPRYKHIFTIVAENKGYKQIIGSPNAPKLNQLAKTYGLASNFYGEVHPSEANYIAMLAGSNFGIHDDDAFYCQAGTVDPFCPHAKEPNYANHTITSPSLLDRLKDKGLTWKGYFESIPTPGSKAIVFPSPIRALYAAKHNGFMNFKSVQDDPDLTQKIVGLEQLTTDLNSGKAPNYSQIILNQCNEMHGLAECPNVDKLIQTGDTQIAKLVNQIIKSPLWTSVDNSAIVITWDEDDNPPRKTDPQGCCGFDPKGLSNFGGGHIATIVITNHGARGVVDPTPYNHYSLLRTTEDAFGITEYLNLAGDLTGGVKPMKSLFALSKSTAK
jgi:phosphatidylinositol-3-phosphatase